LKPPVFDYVCPHSLEQALDLLEQYGDGAKLIAGGQSLMPALNFRLAYPEILIDLNEIASLQNIRVDDDGTVVAGAMNRHRFFETDPMIRERLPLLSYALPFVAHVQIRNRGTIGGSLCHADPAAEWPALCLVSDAEVVMAGKTGTRTVGMEEFSLGLFTTALQPNEILAGIRFPPRASRQSWGFQEIARRRGDFAIAGATCTVDRDESGKCTSARLVIFGATDRAVLLDAAVEPLLGRVPTARDMNEAGRLARSLIPARADHHASAEYRSELIEVLTCRALQQAFSSEG
jgi:CO/xanthine dehydrogenase FAD-binding subunit